MVNPHKRRYSSGTIEVKMMQVMHINDIRNRGEA